MQTTFRLLDDIAKVGAGFLGLAIGCKHDFKKHLRHRIENLVNELDLVSLKDHEIALEMAQKARMQCDLLEERIAQLEKKQLDFSESLKSNKKSIS